MSLEVEEGDSNSELDGLAVRYMSQVRRSNRGHYKAAERLSRGHRTLGIAAAVAVAIVGTSIFATIDSSPELGWRITAGVVAAFAAVVVTLQTTLGLDSRAASHRAAGAAYGRLRRRFEIFLIDCTTDTNKDQRRDALLALVSEIDDLGASSPLIPPSADRAVAPKTNNQQPT